jgi:hypothetical protein
VPITFYDLAYDMDTCCNSKGQRKIQEVFSRALHAKSFCQAMEDAKSPQEKARLLSQAQTGASDFLKAVPFQHKLMIPDAAFSWNVARYLGSEVAQEADARAAEKCSMARGGASPPSRGQEADVVKSQHAYNCKKGGGLIHRHDGIVDTLAAMCVDAGFRIQKEPRGQLEGAGQGGPDILVFGLVPPAGNASLEVGLVNPMASSYVKAASSLPLSAARTRALAKSAEYAKATAAHHLLNHTAVLEVTGALHHSTTSLIKRCGEAAAENPTSCFHAVSQYWSTSTHSQYWRQRLGVSLCNSKFTMNTITHSMGWHKHQHSRGQARVRVQG